VLGGYGAAHSVACATRLFLPATSLGGVESLIEHRRAIEPPDSRVPEGLLRLSVGIEDVGDLIADLDQALDRAQ
jgi:cystathionine gamma-synthase